MATWVHPASWSQSAKANRSAVIVRKVRISFTGSSPSILVMRHAVTVFLWTSRPQHWGYITSILHLHALRPRTGCPLHAASLLRASARRSDRRWCLRASRSYCWQACGTRIFRPSACGGLATSIALFMRGGEGYPHDLLLANSKVPQFVCHTCLLGRPRSLGRPTQETSVSEHRSRFANSIGSFAERRPRC